MNINKHPALRWFFLISSLYQVTVVVYFSYPRPPPFRAGGRRLFEKWDKRLTAHTCESFLSPSWDYYSQCHWPRCVRRWAGNHSASDVNGSGVQSTQLGHGETLTFLILFLHLSFFSVLHCCKRDMQDGGILTSTKIFESSSIILRLITFGSAWGYPLPPRFANFPKLHKK